MLGRARTLCDAEPVSCALFALSQYRDGILKGWCADAALFFADDWINATHILKAAAYDKPTRTRILEREVQKGVHEKVQGGYGKYQGTSLEVFVV